MGNVSCQKATSRVLCSIATYAEDPTKWVRTATKEKPFLNIGSPYVTHVTRPIGMAGGPSWSLHLSSIYKKKESRYLRAMLKDGIRAIERVPSMKTVLSRPFEATTSPFHTQGVERFLRVFASFGWLLL
jgi:hypothetical protein